MRDRMKRPLSALLFLSASLALPASAARTDLFRYDDAKSELTMTHSTLDDVDSLWIRAMVHA
jgi:hypothetical protein